MTPITVVLADDHALLREGLRSLLGAQPDLRVVGEAATLEEAADRLRATGAHVLILDLSMPGWSSESVRKLHTDFPHTRIVIFTMHDDPACLRLAQSVGALGYILKSSPNALLLAAIRGAAAGESAIDPYFQQPAADPPGGGVDLSPRERELLDLIIQGYTHQEIAGKLFISVKTVETYKARLKEKTGLKSRSALMHFGQSLQIQRPRPPAAAIR